MRLLRLNEDGTIGFANDVPSGGPIPPYAILSHTWALDNNEEVTFEEMNTGAGVAKPGYAKIRFCAEQARMDGLQHFWIDTCCINKTINHELSQAISSMFRWYRNSQHCYVYLPDVPGPLDDLQSRDSVFWRSRWFTRGWTLQELLAPYSVIFFSRDNQKLGNKSMLAQHIQDFTGLPALALQGEPLSHFGVEDRFRWMQGRDTKIPEDKVYALIGIFDVEMSLVYGEGLTRANDRLRSLVEKRERCIKELHLTDPRADKRRIEDDKGGLLKDSYKWILENHDFQQWRQPDSESRLLWIKGDPGKGKTMLLCGIANELDSARPKTGLLSYFFCQASDARINNATSVLRGLIYMLIDQQPCLSSHLETQYERAGKALFEDTNSWVTLAEAFTNMLRDSRPDPIVLMVDALDECIRDLPKILRLFVRTLPSCPRVKWIISSRNWRDIENVLDTATHSSRLSLELNQESVSAAVEAFIEFKVAGLSRYKPSLLDYVRGYLSENAQGTFLWVALVCQELSIAPAWKALQILNTFPPGLKPLYRRMLSQIRDSVYAEICISFLATSCQVYRPLTLDELPSVLDLPDEISNDEDALAEIIGLCGSFLTLKLPGRVISFVHQSAKDFLLNTAFEEVFPAGISAVHQSIYRRTMKVLSDSLRRDIYGISAAGTHCYDMKEPIPDPLNALRYSCTYWIEHVHESALDMSTYHGEDLRDGGIVDTFLRAKCLYWLEALGLCSAVPQGIRSLLKLRSITKDNGSTDLVEVVYDVLRFTQYYSTIIMDYPLQVYASGLVFSPQGSVLRELFEREFPTWIVMRPLTQDTWSPCLQTLEGHTSSVNSVAFSGDGHLVASGSRDWTIKIWDTTTGTLQQTLEDHSDIVQAVAFSGDRQLIASGSNDGTIKIWSISMGTLQQTLVGHNGYVYSVAFSRDSRLVACGFSDSTIKIWDLSADTLRTLDGHSDFVCSVSFTSNARLVASGSYDTTIKIWDTVTGALRWTLEGHSGCVNSVAFSGSGHLVASGSGDKTIKIWDTRTGKLQRTLESHVDSVNSVAVSDNGQLVASGSGDKTIKISGTAMGELQQTLEGHSGAVNSIALSGDGQLVASGSLYGTVRIWDTTLGMPQQTPSGNSRRTVSVAVSSDGQLVAFSYIDNTINIWSTTTGVLQQSFATDNLPTRLSFSPQGDFLFTNREAFQISKSIRESNQRTIHSPTARGPFHRVSAYGLTSDGYWITQDGENVLWIPPDYRPGHVDIRGATIATFCGTAWWMRCQASPEATLN